MRDSRVAENFLRAQLKTGMLVFKGLGTPVRLEDGTAKRMLEDLNRAVRSVSDGERPALGEELTPEP
ncbi:MAG: hypothetical protein ACLFP8_00890 [Alphaproteobacteria bacterium]